MANCSVCRCLCSTNLGICRARYSHSAQFIRVITGCSKTCAKPCSKGDHLETTAAPKLVWNTQLSPELLNILVLNPVDLSLSGLWRYVKFLREQGSATGRYELALWNKLLQPLAAVSLVLVAASIIFGPLRQSSMGTRVFVGLMIGIVFRISQDMLGPASLVFGFTPILASLTPILISLGAGFFMLRRR